MSKNAAENYQRDGATFAEIGRRSTALRQFKFTRLGPVDGISMQYFIGQRHFVRMKCRVSWQCSTSIGNWRCLWRDKLKGMYTGLEFSQWFWILLKHIKGDMAETARRIVRMARLAYTYLSNIWNWMLVARMFLLGNRVWSWCVTSVWVWLTRGVVLWTRILLSYENLRYLINVFFLQCSSFLGNLVFPKINWNFQSSEVVAWVGHMSRFEGFVMSFRNPNKFEFF